MANRLPRRIRLAGATLAVTLIGVTGCALNPDQEDASDEDAVDAAQLYSRTQAPEQPESPGATHSSTSATSGTANPGATPVPGDVYRVPMPVDAFNAQVEELGIVITAEQITTRNCMERLGFEYTVPPAMEPLDVIKIGVDPLLGVVSMSHAEEYGYHPDYSMLTAEAPSSAPTSDKSEESAEYRQALGSDGEDGCSREGMNATFGVTSVSDEASESFGTVSNGAYNQATQDKRFKTAIVEWAKCMTDQGYEVTEPAELLSESWGDKPTAPEITQAIADVGCKQELDLWGLFIRLQTEAQEVLIDENIAGLTEYRQAWEAKVREAERIIAEDAE
jgi:hypothetical protein